MVLAGEKPRYFVTCLDVPDVAGLDPVRADVECVPGIPMRLKLIDKETGKTAKSVEVSYWPIYPNAHVRDVPGYAPHGGGPYNQGIFQDDGTYLLGVLPGPGAVTVRTAQGKYRPACVDPKAFFKVDRLKPGEGVWPTAIKNLPLLRVRRRHRRPATDRSSPPVVLVNPPDDSGPIAAEAVLERDPRREVRVLDPDAKPWPA